MVKRPYKIFLFAGDEMVGCMTIKFPVEIPVEEAAKRIHTDVTGPTVGRRLLPEWDRLLVLSGADRVTLPHTLPEG